MGVFFIICGLADIGLGIFCLITKEFVIGISLILSGISLIYVVCGADQAFKNEKRIAKLEKEFKEKYEKMDLTEKYLGQKIGIEKSELDKEVRNDTASQYKDIEYKDMFVGFPVTLKKEKKSKYKNLVFPVGCLGTIFQKNGNCCAIEFKYNDEKIYIKCTSDEIENAYLTKYKRENNIL